MNRTYVRFWASHEYVNRLWRMHCIIDIKKCLKLESVYMCIKHAPIDGSVWSEEKKTLKQKWLQLMFVHVLDKMQNPNSHFFGKKERVRACLVPKKFAQYPSHRILRHMHRVLNVNEKKTNCTVGWEIVRRNFRT